MVLMEKSYKNHGTVTQPPDSPALERPMAARRRVDAPLAPCPMGVAVTSRGQMPLDGNVLACMRFGTAPSAGDPRVIAIPLPQLEEACDISWVSTTPVHTGVIDQFRYACNDEVLFGWLHLEEDELRTMERTVKRAYIMLDLVLNRLEYPHWLRVWNYLAHINDGDGDQERYRLFSLGRHHALALKPGFENELAAATGIGTQASGLTLCVMAGSRPGSIQVENPRQVSAFRYPREYGPRSPSFSRATLRRWRDRTLLFISGTASVVGHASVHPDRPAAQLEETLRNIDALVAHAAERNFPDVRPDFGPVLFTVYVRTPEIFEAVRDVVERRLRSRASTIVLQGDICRHDLLLEVEALYAWDHPVGQ
jgi:chorismate lyase/3-hydroxybenzoate synthase